MNMNFLMRWLPFWPNRPSTLVALRKILPRHTFRALKFITSDKREIFECASKLSGEPISSLVSKVGENLGIPTLHSLVSDQESIKNTFKNREALYQYGVFPLMKNDQLVGIACVDPRSLEALTPYFRSVPVFISSWSAIKRSLDSIQWETRDLLQKLLKKLYLECNRFDADTVILTVFPKPSYMIRLSDGRVASGQLKHDLRLVIETSLVDKEFLISDESTAKVQKKGELFEVTFQKKNMPVISKSEPVVVSLLQESKLVERKPSGLVERQVLIVDDNDTFARVLERYLSKNGFSTVRAIDGAHALSLLSGEDKPSLVVTDIHMPTMNGFEFIRRIKEDKVLQQIPVLVLSSDGDVEAKLALFSYGVEAFVEKREDPRIICAHVKRLLVERIAA